MYQIRRETTTQTSGTKTVPNVIPIDYSFLNVAELIISTISRIIMKIRTSFFSVLHLI